MSALIAAILSNPTLVALFGGAMAAIAAYLRGRASGAARERDRRASAELQSARKAKEIEDEVQGLGHDDIDQRLARWLRDK